MTLILTSTLREMNKYKEDALWASSFVLSPVGFLVTFQGFLVTFLLPLYSISSLPHISVVEN